MQGLLIDLIGKPEGIIIWQLVYATQFTIYLSLIAFIGGGSIAALICFARICPSTTAQGFATAYIWLFQSVPLLMLLFLIGLGVPKLLGIDVDPWMAATISLLLFTSAYLAEVWRSAFAAVDLGQWEAGYALGLRFSQIFTQIIFP